VVKIKCSQKLKFENRIENNVHTKTSTTGPKVATKTRKARVTNTEKVKATVHEVLVEAGLGDEEDEPTGFVINVNDSPVPFHASSDEDEPLALKAIRKAA